MKFAYFIVLSFFITSCSAKHYMEISDETYKTINIPEDYTVIHCSCDKNPLLLKIVQELREVGLKVMIIDDYNKLDEIKSSFKSIVIYGYSKKINGSPKNYDTTRLVSYRESRDCGKGCSVSRSWNKLVRNTVISSGDSIHNNVLIYKIDENTELLLALNSGDKYSIKLETKQEKGSKENVISESYEYEFVSGTNKVRSNKKRVKLEKPIEVEKNEKGILIEYMFGGIGKGWSINYFYNDRLSFGFEDLDNKYENTKTHVESFGEVKTIYKEELSTNFIYVNYHARMDTYFRIGFFKRDWLIEQQHKRASDNLHLAKTTATFGDNGFFLGAGWNPIGDVFSFRFGLLSMPFEPDYDYFEENVSITEAGKESWVKEVEARKYLQTPIYLAVGLIF